MLVKCISSGGSKSRDLITVGKYYTLYNYDYTLSNFDNNGYYMYGLSYYIINDGGIRERYSSKLFISVQEVRVGLFDELGI